MGSVPEARALAKVARYFVKIMNETPRANVTTGNLLRLGLAALDTTSNVLFNGAFGSSDIVYLIHRLHKCSDRFGELLLGFGGANNRRN